MTKEKSELDKLKEMLREYLSYSSSDGNYRKRTDLREKLKELSKE